MKGKSGIVFGTHREIEGLFQCEWNLALEKIHDLNWEGVVKFGSAGAVATSTDGERHSNVPAVIYPEPFVGAGDFFSGAYLARKNPLLSNDETLSLAGKFVEKYFSQK